MAERPIRIQRRRTKGWRIPEGAVYVGRPSLWGNGWALRDTVGLGIPPKERAGWVVGRYRAELGHLGMLSDYAYYVSDAKWQAVYDDIARTGAANMAEYAPFVLRGHDLACWCPLCPVHADGLPLGVDCPDCPPCHADVVLELANR